VNYKPILLTGLLCCSVSGAHARGLYALLGLGTLKCLVFVDMETDKDMKPLGDEAFAAQWSEKSTRPVTMLRASGPTTKAVLGFREWNSDRSATASGPCSDRVLA
jgi:hypothetical protein